MEDTNSLYDRVRSEIKYNIINGVYPMGKRLKAKMLADELYVSRTPINKALSSLYEEGLLCYNRNVGYSVRIITIEDVEEISKIRTALDVLSFKEASLKMNKNNFDYARSLVRDAERAFNNNDIDELREASKSFNETIYEFSDMPRLKMIISGLDDYIEVLRKFSFNSNNPESTNSRRKISVEEHSRMLDLMEEKKFDELETCIRDHLADSKDFIISQSHFYKDEIFDRKEDGYDR